MEVDHYLNGYEARRQKELAGHRLTAHLIFSALAEKGQTPAEFLYLPAVDGPKRPQAVEVGGETMEEFRARLAAKNKQKLAEKAAA